MIQTVQAVYEHGQLRLLEPIELAEGQQVEVIVKSILDKDALRAALGDLVASWPNTSDDSDADLELMADEISQAFQGTPTLSEWVIEDRR
ncbi:MAG: hypothetical protein BroJett018_02500 [Chloroflexota bacterium]|nr:DUF104 domain-containing protein [Chloroflexota bacterium]NOG61956.1 antitoxin family protein [Chloroflexota bacterium]GIK62456.1 MAG: hypothetical protein BroJett018_02500 [Chloroflexota bacterium]